ncbi:hypothetical protein O181_047498 [Austropuccinia psidii MF-1]|uniref:Chromo domain-containing protein n=1 Tax=Austropuccinia psidii MF-1 TaxID=1389203 RepID=A0A9Q3DU45_9BASI|nr:hypothetical protein [Austropuccinia psidii MF-1]
MDLDFKEVDHVLVSTLNFSNLKGPQKMRYSLVGPFTIIKRIRKIQGRSNSKRSFLGNTHYSRNSGSGDSPGPVKKIIKARKIRLNGKAQRQYLVRFKNQTAEKYKWLAEEAIPDRNLHLRRFRGSRRAVQSHK